jgi:hypothetical protein
MSAKSRAAVGATRQDPKRSDERRKQVRDRIALGVAAGLLLIGVVVYLQSRTEEGPAPTRAAEQPGLQEAPAATPLKKGGTLEPAARDVAERFIVTAVGRTRLDEAWELVTPEFRSGVTRAQWRRGELPVPPFPARDLETTGFDVLESSANKVLLQVLLVPKPGTAYVPTRYDLTIERASASAPWKVSYANPYAPPGRFANPE